MRRVIPTAIRPARPERRYGGGGTGEQGEGGDDSGGQNSDTSTHNRYLSIAVVVVDYHPPAAINPCKSDASRRMRSRGISTVADLVCGSMATMSTKGTSNAK
jgi:hypothetical protein